MIELSAAMNTLSAALDAVDAAAMRFDVLVQSLHALARRVGIVTLICVVAFLLYRLWRSRKRRRGSQPYGINESF